MIRVFNISHVTHITLISSTFARNELEAARELVKAFFPEVLVMIADADDVPGGLGTLNHDEADSKAEAIVLPGLIRIEREGEGPLFAFWGADRIRRDDSVPIIHEYSLQRVRDYPVKIILSGKEIADILAYKKIGTEAPAKFVLKHGILRLLTQVCGRELPWGILTGIRPSKLVHRMDDQKLSPDQQVEVLTRRYGVRMDKALLLQKIALVQRPYLKKFTAHPKHIALYLGIPFCPTRCSYCSFPAFPIDRDRQALTSYLQALCAEIAQVGELMAEFGLRADSLYLGGGTPTVLSVDELKKLFEEIKKFLPLAPFLEFSVEAGRPDTLSSAKFELMRDVGVNRLSVNPQTMHAETLKRIGRAHKVEDVVAAYDLARASADWIINMDLILGLPEEGMVQVERTLELLQPLAPDNLTVHTLALKRGSREWVQGYRHTSAKVIEEMQNLTQNVVRKWGLDPYYLYRQKHIAGNLENIGYAKPGLECRYNIAIMEERQSVIGLGAGASSKIVHPVDYSLKNFQHPSDWKSYAVSWRSGHAKRRQALEAVLCHTTEK